MNTRCRADLFRRPGAWCFLAALCGWVCLVAADVLAAEAKRPNILFLLADDQRADTIHALGNEVIQTPTLDRLVSKGTTFTRAYCMGGNNPAVCIPSRAMMLSGRQLFRVDNQLSQAPLLPTVLQQQGYVTFGCGKWHNGEGSYTRSFAKGGAIFFGGMTNQFHPTLFSYDTNGDYQARRPKTSDKFSSEAIADEAIQFLREHRDRRPFFCYVSFTVPHDPRTPPVQYASKYNYLRLKPPKNFLPQHPFNNGEMTVRDEKLLPWPRPKEELLKEIAAYYGLISHMDEQIGRILDVLRETRLDENTIIAFTSDQGLALGSHGLLGKQNLYEHSMRVPLILVGPGVAAEKRCDELVYLLDLFPTLCELTGVPAPPGLDGRSLVPSWTGQPHQVRDSIFCAYRDVQRSVCDGEWKLIRYPQINRSQLFHVSVDPDEINDLSGNPEFVLARERLTDRMAQWQRELGDKLPLSTDRPQPEQIKLN